MNTTEHGTHSRALLDPGDAAIQLGDAQQDMIEISRHIVLRKETGGRNHGRASQSEKHSSRQQRGRTEADYPISLVFRHGTFGHGAWDMRHCINAVNQQLAISSWQLAQLKQVSALSLLSAIVPGHVKQGLLASGTV